MIEVTLHIDSERHAHRLLLNTLPRTGALLHFYSPQARAQRAYEVLEVGRVVHVISGPQNRETATVVYASRLGVYPMEVGTPAGSATTPSGLTGVAGAALAALS